MVQLPTPSGTADPACLSSDSVPATLGHVRCADPPVSPPHPPAPPGCGLSGCLLLPWSTQ